MRLPDRSQRVCLALYRECARLAGFWLMLGARALNWCLQTTIMAEGPSPAMVVGRGRDLHIISTLLRAGVDHDFFWGGVEFALWVRALFWRTRSE